ncbi:hypothetical protein LJB91_03435 [Bacteroidales bacterium OttesenSCG-928-L03]|nr:hypothetical protein [Bacteroidales bacterium OttesenSCG-928-L03]
MHKTKSIALIALLAVFPLLLSAQNSTNSPYTRFGLGKLADQSFASQRAMGGIGIGLYDSKSINPLNPASFSSVDSMTFMFDMGVTGQVAWFEYDGNTSRKVNGNLEYVAMQFPLSKRLGMGVGIMPISYVGYNFGDSIQTENLEEKGEERYAGKGGLQKVYATLSYNIADRLSLGVNVGYMFGDIFNDKAVILDNSYIYGTYYSDTLRTAGLLYEVGLQYIHPLGKDKQLVIGAVYAPKTKFNATQRSATTTYTSGSSSAQTTASEVRSGLGFEMPQKIGVGASFMKKRHYTVGADFQMQQWGDAKYYGKTDTLSNNIKISLGGEYTPVYLSNNLIKRMTYRAGAYYSDSYFEVGGTGYKEYGITFGLGIPTAATMGNRRSMLNLTFDYTLLRPNKTSSFQYNGKEMGLVNEQYFKITASYTFNELWFFKRKVQ